MPSTAPRAHGRDGTAVASLTGMLASTTTTRDVVVVAPHVSLRDAWALMRREHVRHLPVVRAGALVGMLSDRDVLIHASEDKEGVPHLRNSLTVADAMTPTPVETCESITDISDIARLMVTKKIDAIPVVRGLHLIGLVTSTDLLHLLIDRKEARQLPFEFRLIDDPRAYA